MVRYLWTLTSVWGSITGLILVIQSIIEFELLEEMTYYFEVQLSGVGKNDTSRLNSD